MSNSGNMKDYDCGDALFAVKGIIIPVIIMVLKAE